MPATWPQVKQIFQEALRVAPSERDHYLDDACDGNSGLRLEVESLLISLNDAENFLEQPIVFADESPRATPVWSLNAGQVISHYEVVEPVDSGGMGEVYSAIDRKLNRRVALKVLRHDIAEDTGRLKRFSREAETVSSLNHPNILTVFDFDTVDDIHFVVTEFVDGETLRTRLDRAGSLSTTDAVEIAIQTATGLAAAHAAGVIHRDIKPPNLMIRSDGILKILDFGLAKFTEEHRVDLTTQPLVSLPGVIMGTASYMSPEQARGFSIDRRSDIFSLGVVLYEMLTGVSPFRAPTSADSVAALIQRDPPKLSELRSDIPFELDRIGEKTLAKEKSDRYQTAAELINDLKPLGRQIELSRSSVVVTRVRVREPERSSRVPLLVLLTLLVLATLGAGYWFFVR